MIPLVWILLAWTLLAIVWIVMLIALGLAVRGLWRWWRNKRAFEAECRNATIDYERD